MARAHLVPDGKWVQTDTKTYWLNYATILSHDDLTGNDRIQLQGEIRTRIAEAAHIMSEHNIKLFNVYTMQDNDPKTWDTIHRIAIGFEHAEDLMLAKMILKCEV